MSSLHEDLALERLALAELEAQAEAAWKARQYPLALLRRREATRARERVLELEARSVFNGRAESLPQITEEQFEALTLEETPKP
jgi:hypothetical protein